MHQITVGSQNARTKDSKQTKKKCQSKTLPTATPHDPHNTQGLRQLGEVDLDSRESGSGEKTR